MTAAGLCGLTPITDLRCECGRRFDPGDADAGQWDLSHGEVVPCECFQCQGSLTVSYHTGYEFDRDRPATCPDCGSDGGAA